MNATVFLLGGTGRTGGRVLRQLLERGVTVRAIVRSSARLPEGVAGKERLEAIEADLLSLGDEELKRHVAGCDAIISCLGHTTTTMKGIFGEPRDLMTQAVAGVCAAVQALKPEKKVKLVLMSSVSVNGPAADNQNAADYLGDEISLIDPAIQWVVVRSDSLVEGDVSEYKENESLLSGLFKPKTTAMANIAHFMCELVSKPQLWDAWKGKMPTIVNSI